MGSRRGLRLRLGLRLGSCPSLRSFGSPGWSSDSAGMCTQWKQERTSEPTTYALRFTEMGGRWECNVACRMSRPSRSQSSTSARRSCLGAICTAQIAGAGARTWVEAHLCSPVRRLRCRSIRQLAKATSWPVRCPERWDELRLDCGTINREPLGAQARAVGKRGPTVYVPVHAASLPRLA